MSKEYYERKNNRTFIMGYLLSKVGIYNVPKNRLTLIINLLRKYDFLHEKYIRVTVENNGHITEGFNLENLKKLFMNLDINEFKKQYGVGETTLKYIEPMCRYFKEES